MTTRRGRALLTAALLVFGVVFGILSLRLSSSAGRFPLFAVTITIVMASLQLMTDLRRPNPDDGVRDVGEATSERAAIVWTAMLVAGVSLAGLSVTLPVFTGLYWRIKDRASWRHAVGVALCVLGIVQGIFGWLLRVELYDGIVGQWLRR